jgi:hypothetical protein
MTHHSESSVLRLAAVLAIVWMAGQPALAAPPECAAEITAELKSKGEVDDGIRLEFDVHVISKEACASVTYDLILVELLPNGQWKSVRATHRLELRAGTATALVQHVMASDLRLLEHEARVVECSPCESP